MSAGDGPTTKTCSFLGMSCACNRRWKTWRIDRKEEKEGFSNAVVWEGMSFSVWFKISWGLEGGLCCQWRAKPWEGVFV